VPIPGSTTRGSTASRRWSGDALAASLRITRSPRQVLPVLELTWAHVSSRTKLSSLEVTVVSTTRGRTSMTFTCMISPLKLGSNFKSMVQVLRGVAVAPFLPAKTHKAPKFSFTVAGTLRSNTMRSGNLTWISWSGWTATSSTVLQDGITAHSSLKQFQPGSSLSLEESAQSTMKVLPGALASTSTPAATSILE